MTNLVILVPCIEQGVHGLLILDLTCGFLPIKFHHLNWLTNVHTNNKVAEYLSKEHIVQVKPQKMTASYTQISSGLDLTKGECLGSRIMMRFRLDLDMVILENLLQELKSNNWLIQDR